MNTNIFEKGKIITFYSYKGGTGRSMAVANIACLLAKRFENSSRKILIIDWDLEAPGLHRYFLNHSKQKIDLESPGLIDYFCDIKKLLHEKPDMYEKIDSQNGYEALDRAIPLENYIIPKTLQGIDFLKAGNLDYNYPELVNSFDWADFFDKYRRIFDAFRELISSKYEYCLIDSRTGLTDISGICSMIMPEKLVTVFTPNSQSLYGLVDLIKKAVEYRRASSDFRPLSVFPLPGRVDLAEKDLKTEWRRKYEFEFERLFRKIYELDECNLSFYFDQIQLPHVSYYSYGEKIAVVEEFKRDTLSLSKAYERFLHYLIDYDFAWQDVDQDEFPLVIDQISQAKRGSPKEYYEQKKRIAKVFISSTLTDLIEYRKAAFEVVNQSGLISLAVEFLGTKAEKPEYACLNEVEECDLFIGIYAHRYGFIPKGQNKSVTQLEYELAKKLGRPCLCFIVDQDFPWKPAFIDHNKQSELEAFFEHVKHNQVVSFFTSVSDFQSKLSVSLARLLREMGEKELESFPTVFLSFAGDDRKIAQLLAELLKKDGINVWMAETTIQVGEEFDKVIFNAIDKCRVFMPLISKNSKKLLTDEGSLKYHIREWEFAHSRSLVRENLKIIPVIIDNTEYMYDKFKTFYYLRIPNGRSGNYEKLTKILKEIQENV